jgi:hypothetical protein
MLTQLCPIVQNACPLHFARELEEQLLTYKLIKIAFGDGTMTQHDLLVVLASVESNECPDEVYLLGYNGV